MWRADVRKSGCPPFGFTLVEVVVSMGIVATAIVALIASFLSGLILVESGRSMAVAGSDARAVFEEMRRVSDQGLNTVARTNWTGWARNSGLTNLTNETVSVRFRNPNADPLEATVTVSWVERDRARAATFTGLVTQR